MADPAPPFYQLAQAAAGTWRVRVFNLPAHVAGQAPTLPLLWTLHPGTACGWHQDAEGKLTVLRLVGPDRASLTELLGHLRTHGVMPAAVTPAPAEPRSSSPSDSSS